MSSRSLRPPLRLTAIALLLGGLVSMTTPGAAVAQIKPNAHPWFQPRAEGAKTTPSEVLSHYLSTRWAYTGRKPHVAICTRVTPIEIPPMVLGELVRGGWGADSIWIDPTCPVGASEREAIAGAKGPYELVRITTFVIGWEASFIETIVEPADSPGGVWHRAYRERFTMEHVDLPKDRLEVFREVRPQH